MRFDCSGFRFLLVILFILQLSACTTVSTPGAVDDPDIEWSTRQSQLNKIQHWKINGRLAITNKAEVWHLSFNWQQQNENYKIHLSGPFGAGAVLLTGDDIGVIIKSGENTSYATDPEQLLYESTGVQIPLQHLFYWVRGLPNPDSEISNQKLDSLGRLQKLSQNDWNIRFKRYSTTDKIALPSKIFIKNNQLDIRLVIEDWSLL